MIRANILCFRPAIPASLVVVVMVAASGCTSSRPLQEPRPPVEVEASEPQVTVSPDVAITADNDVEEASVYSLLLEEVERWAGTPHRWGGTTPSGADCSGFVSSVFSGLFGLALPRTTSEQALHGAHVRDTDLQAGDLVFFRPSKRSNHVGIYLDGGEFAHISSSRGLMISHLDESYWRRSYWTARRVLNGADGQQRKRPLAPAEDRVSARDGARSGDRGGW